MSGPLSVPLPDSLRRRLARHAKKHQIKLATAARSLIDERLRELEARKEAETSDEWQRAQAWATWDRIQREGLRPVPAERIQRYVDNAIAGLRRRRKHGSARTK
jgi:hypothetical protein